MGLLRIILALSVVATHAGLPHIFNSTVSVKLFFVISGFYMALVLSGKYPSTSEGRSRFYKARLLRLCPTYYLSIVIALIVAVLASGRGDSFFGDFWARWHGLSVMQLAGVIGSQIAILGQDIFLFLKIQPSSFGFTKAFELLPKNQQAWTLMLNPPAWSLATELMFYAVAPFLIRLKDRWLVSIILISFAARLVCAPFLPIQDDPWVYRFFPFEMGTFVSGMLAYRLFLIWKPQFETATIFSKSLPWIGLLLLVFLQKIHGSALWLPFLMIPLMPYLFALTKSNKRDRWIGEFSYPVYILHWPILFGMAAFGVPHFGPIGTVSTLVVSYVVLRWIDAPIEVFRQKVASGKRVETPA